jgi:hypothetical protein
LAHKDGGNDDAKAAARAGVTRRADWKRKPRRNDTHASTDKAYDTRDFIAACHRMRVTLHLASSDTRIGGSAIDGRTTPHTGYAISQTIRKRSEEHFGWDKAIVRIRQMVYRGIRRVAQHFKVTMPAINLVRMARMLSALPE